MAGFHVHAQQQYMGARVQGAQLGDPFGGLVVLHLAVPQSGGDQHRGIGLRTHVVIG